MGHNSSSKYIPEVDKLFIQVYMNEVMKLPNTPHEWKAIANRYAKRWNFHNTLGAIDGKHVAIAYPPNGGSLYHSNK